MEDMEKKLMFLLATSPCISLAGTYGTYARAARDLINNGVTVQRWIPVTERLPEAGKRVLATDGGFVGEFYVNAKGQWRRYNVNHHELLMALDILWWQDMPEPPKEDGAL